MDYPVKTAFQLAQIVRGVRKERRLTQATVAEKMGSLQSKVSAFEARPGTASVDRLFRLLSILELELVIKDRRAAPKQQRKKLEW